MTATKATLRRISQAPVQSVGNKTILIRRVKNAPYKIKILLPQTKMLEVKKE